MGGVKTVRPKRTCYGLFTAVDSQLSELDPNGPADAEVLRYRQGIIPDLMIDATSIDLPWCVTMNIGKLPRRCRPQVARIGTHGALRFEAPYLGGLPELDPTSVVL